MIHWVYKEMARNYLNDNKQMIVMLPRRGRKHAFEVIKRYIRRYSQYKNKIHV